MLCRLAVAFSIALALDAAFWFSADFSSFTPRSPGVIAERLYFVGLTATGPLAEVIYLHAYLHAPNLAETLLACGLSLGLVVLGLAFRRFWFARLAGYGGVGLWFFFGFLVAGCRIT